ncbi:hypothetical protein A1019T_02445 [Psychrobacter pasteurii]|uniref:Uncharacterized protein n=1 Tax=Psychrobacter pasteurii TaxID=1945520 RepID=A0A1R4EIY8_9GAMM|nr:hypothetical protein [Psychrobacter pasteurii]SJM38452.1 hypothetical protein A1019T_02445 [Psychrobacter pasteurii]
MNETAGLFRNDQEHTRFNACVGNNGWRGMFSYIEGYQSATLVMLESVLSQYGSNIDFNAPKQAFLWNNDTSIYPILFTARHFIEIYIKQKIHTINYLKVKDNINEKLIKTHNIQELWNTFVDIVERTHDSRLAIYIEKIAPYIQDFNHIDPTGETFRYPFSLEGSMHLEDMGVINILNFYKRFNELSKICEVFTYEMDALVDEYKTGTYTKNLSRKNIEGIAQELPVYGEWNKPSFSDIKKSLKTKLSIGSKELSQAIDIIKNHIEFKRYIYPNIYELQIDKDKLSKILSGSLNEEHINDFSHEEIASLRTLVELGTSVMGGRYYSEDYKNLFDSFLKETRLNEYEKQSNYEYSIRNKHRIKDGLNKINYNLEELPKNTL